MNKDTNPLQTFKIKTKHVLNELAFRVGQGAKLLKTTQQHYTLLYHGVDLKGDTRFSRRFTSQRDFIQHLAFFKKHFRIITLKEAFLQQGAPGDRPTLSVTFDDGYENNFTYALPVLQAAKVPASIFVTCMSLENYDYLWADAVDICTHYYPQRSLVINGQCFEKSDRGVFVDPATGASLYSILKCSPLELRKQAMDTLEKAVPFRGIPSIQTYWKIMSREQIILASQDPLISIGSHGYWHSNLGDIPPELAKKEILDSKNSLENLIQKEVSAIAYPDGSYTRNLVDDSASIGFKEQVATSFLFKEDATDPRIKARLEIYSTSSTYNQILDAFRPKT